MKRGTMALVTAAVLAVAGALVALWLHYMERAYVGVPSVSEAARDNPLLGAERLLAKHGHRLTVTPLLTEQTVAELPAHGTLLLQTGVPSARLAKPLLDWVRRGNTLVMTPMWTAAGAPKSPLPAADHDVVGEHFGTSIETRPRQDDTCRLDPQRNGKPDLPAAQATTEPPDDEEADEDEEPAPAPAAESTPAPADGDTPAPAEADTPAPARAQAARAPRGKPQEPPVHLICARIPALGHALELSRAFTTLRQTDRTPQPLWSDTYSLGVAVYREGRGHVVMTGTDYFNNFELPRYDHAELLLAVAALAGPGTPLVGVQHVETLHWTTWLWRHYAPLIVSVAAILLLWLWRQTRRFGPMLPEPPLARRALLEHIDASARWLWRVPGGRDLLLAAVRATTEHLLRRRAPMLYQQPPAARARHLAGLCGLPQDAVDRALHGPAAGRPLDFTAQISTLHQLRRHYER